MNFKSLLLTALLLVGCVPTAQRQSQISRNAVISSAAISEDIQTTGSEIDLAKPHSDPTGVAHLVSAKASNQAAASKLPAMNAGLALNDTLTKQVTALQAQIADEHTWLLSYRVWQYIKWIMVSATALVVLWIVLDFGTNLGGPIAEVAEIGWHFAWGGLWLIGSKIGDFNEWLAAKISNKATKTIVTKVTPIPKGQ